MSSTNKLYNIVIKITNQTNSIVDYVEASRFIKRLYILAFRKEDKSFFIKKVKATTNIANDHTIPKYWFGVEIELNY